MTNSYALLHSSTRLMKIKNLLSVFLFLLMCSKTTAQVATKYTYTPNSVSAAYTLLTTGQTNVCAGANVSGVTSNAWYQTALTPNTTGAGIPLGFNFQFNCATYTSIGVHTNGFIWFGSGNPLPAALAPISNASANLGGAGTIDGLVAGYSGNTVTRIPFGAGSAIRYRVDGTSPNRIFKIEWAGYKMTGTSNGNATIPSTQIWLYETSNNIEFYINNMNSILINGTRTGQLGIRGATNADFKNCAFTTASTWANIPAGTLNTQTVQTSSSPACWPNPNRMVAWTFTGSCCTPPTTGASVFGYSNVVVNGAASTADFSFDRGNGDGGVIAIAKAGSAPSAPANGTAYTGANTAYGSGTAVGGGFLVYEATGSGSGTINVSLSGLTNGVTYYISVYEYNATATCYSGSALSGNIPIPICSPPSVQASGNSVSNIQTNQADINWTGNGNGDDVIVFFKQGSAITTDPTQTTNYNANAGFGLGDQIGATGARAVYKGTSSSVTVTGLTTNITYHYAIYARNSATNCYAVPPITGSFTSANSPMTTSAQVVTQASVATTVAGAANIQILQVRIDCGTGTAPALVLSQLFFTTAAANGGTTNAADIANAKVYSTGTSSTFAITTQFGSTVTNPSGAFVIGGSTTLVPGSNYFWLTYSISATATVGNFVDAACTMIDIGPIITPSGDPAGNRQIAPPAYCSPTFGSTACSLPPYIDFSLRSASFSGTTFYSGGTCPTNYLDLYSSVTATLNQSSSYALTVNYNASSSLVAFSIYYHAWVDWNNDGIFAEPGERIMQTNVGPAGAITQTSAPFTVSAGAGNYRMRVMCQTDVDPINPCNIGGGQNGEAKDFKITVIASSSPMTYSSSTTTQNTQPVVPNNTNQQIVGLEVVTAGALSPIALSSITFNTNGSTNIAGDATNARVFYTGASGAFATGTQFGSAIANPNGSHTVNGSVTLSPGTNYFWIAYDVSPTAVLGNNLDAEVTSIDVNSTTYTPSVTAPAGVRPISLVYCVPSAGATGCSLGGDSWITAVNLTGTGSTFNFTGGTCLTPFPNNYQINPYTGDLNIGGSYTTTMIKGGSSSGARFIAWADWNNDGDFTDLGEMIMDVTQTAASATGTSFTVPALAAAGAHRLRTWIGYTGTIVTSDIGTVTTGCEVLNGFSNQGEIRDFTINLLGGGTAPSITSCPGNISVNNDSGLCNAIVSYSAAIATGTPAPTITYSQNSGTSFPVGTTTVTITASNGNLPYATCTFDVVVTDNQNPTITCPADITTCNPVVTFNPTTNDNCGVASVVCVPASGSTFQYGTTVVSCTVTDVNGLTASCTFNVIVDSSSIAATSATSDAPFNEICLGNSTNLTVNGGSLGTGAVWNWYSGSCTGTLIGTGTSISVSPTTNTTYFVKAIGTCNTTTCVQITITVKTIPPFANVVVPPIINLPAYACNGTFIANINVPAVSGATQYIWDGPTGTTFNGGFNPYTSATPSADITFGNPNGSGYYIGIQAANSCGVSVRKVQWVRGTVGVPASIIPATAGLTTYCPNTSATFSCPPVTAATGYLWTITGDATVTPLGTSVTVNFGAAWTSGTLCVSAQTPCYTSAPKCLALSTTSATAYTPQGIFAVCPGTSQTYSVPADPAIASYTWTLPANASGSSSTNSISVSFLSGFTSGSICVQATTICGVPLAQKCKSINSGSASRPSSITGPTTGLCGQTVVYTCPFQTGATFNWTVPAGSTINSGQGTNALSVTLGTFGTSTVCVSASNGCGASAPRCITVKGAPNAPGAITAIPSSWCANEPGIEFGVDVSPLSGSYTLSWLYPTATVAQYVLGGGNSTSLILNWLTGNGPVHVTASNACGNATRTSTQGNTCREAALTGSTNQSSQSINVNPNPTSGIINLEFSSFYNGKANVDVQDLSGRILVSQSLTVVEGLNNTQLDLSKMAKGIYMLNVNSNDATNKVKIVLE